MDINWISICTYAGLFYLVFRLGQTRGRLEVLQEFLRRPDDITKIVQKYAKEETRLDRLPEEEMTVERHDQILYVYTKSGEFLAQGSSIEECLTKIETRFPERKFRGHLSKEQADNLGISVK